MGLGIEQDHCVWPDFISANVPVKNDIILFFFFLMVTCACPRPPALTLIIIKLLPPSHSSLLIPMRIALLLLASCLNVSLRQEPRVSLWSINSAGVCFSAVRDKALFCWQPKHTARAICWDSSQSDGNGDEPAEGGRTFLSPLELGFP